MSLIGAILLEIPLVVGFLLLAWVFFIFCWTLASTFTWLVVIAVLTLLYFYWQRETRPSPEDVERRKDLLVVIVGAGFSGICAAVKLKLQRIPFVVLEKSSHVGGTWYGNRYPGCGCDTPSHMYGFSFRLNPFWSHFNAGQQEILKYLEETCQYYGVDTHVRLNTKVKTCSFDSKSNKWNIVTSKGDLISCNFLISGVGVLHVPKFPDIPGQNSFQGERLHTSQWPENFKHQGKIIAVIGTGTSAVQLIPSIAGTAKHVHIFQRMPVWVSPKLDLHYPKFIQKLFHDLPFIMTVHRWYLFFRLESIFQLAFSKESTLHKLFQFIISKYMQFQLNDSRLRNKLVPDYAIGCKRIAVSNDYITSFNRPNVTLVDTKIKEISRNGITTDNSDEIKVDKIIYATGFDAIKSICGNMDILRPSDGKCLAEIWGNEPTAYLGTFQPGFPNFFSLLGPATELGHNSVVWMVEQQMNLILQAINLTIDDGHRTITVTEKANEKFQETIREELKGRVFSSPCSSWYQNQKGFSFAVWPSHCLKFWWKTRRIVKKHFNFQ